MKTIKLLLIILLITGIHTAQAQTTTATNINKVITAYLALKDALVADDSQLANQKAKEFTAALLEVSNNQLDASQKTTWLTYGDKLRYDGEHISESNKLGHQREHFGSLSKNMYAVIKAFKDNSMVLYEQYCPMKKQWWISETSVIKNPYYGKEMIDCGVTKATLSVH